MTNKELLERYPWLRRYNRITDEWMYDGSTELDDMPDGWRAAFGEQMCEELNNEILTWDKVVQERFRILQIKEKWGGLRFYVMSGSAKLYEIIGKYEELSRHTCIECGAPATKISRGWISPYCDKCAQEMIDHRVGESFVPIGEYYERSN